MSGDPVEVLGAVMHGVETPERSEEELTLTRLATAASKLAALRSHAAVLVGLPPWNGDVSGAPERPKDTRPRFE